jgi:hypothetical protein
MCLFRPRRSLRLAATSGGSFLRNVGKCSTPSQPRRPPPPLILALCSSCNAVEFPQLHGKRSHHFSLQVLIWAASNSKQTHVCVFLSTLQEDKLRQLRVCFRIFIVLPTQDAHWVSSFSASRRCIFEQLTRDYAFIVALQLGVKWRRSRDSTCVCVCGDKAALPSSTATTARVQSATRPAARVQNSWPQHVTGNSLLFWKTEVHYPEHKALSCTEAIIALDENSCQTT